MPFNAEAFRAAERGGDAPPDGHYDAELIDSTIITANADGRQWIKLTWKVLAGAQRDECWESWHSIDQYDKNGEPSQALGITVGTLRTMGVDVDSVRDEHDLLSAARDLQGHGFDVEIKRKGIFVNTNVSHVLEHVAPSLPSTGNGPAPSSSSSSRAPSNAIYGDDVQQPAQPAQQSSLGEQARTNAEPQPTGRSDVTPPDAEREYAQPDKSPQRGDIDPETGEPFPF